MTPRVTGSLCFMTNTVKQRAAVIQPPNKCNTCNVSFNDKAVQRAHYKSEWHLYNLKRKGNGINPVTYEEFMNVKERLIQMMSVKNSEEAAKYKPNQNKTARHIYSNGVTDGGNANRNSSDRCEAWPQRRTVTSRLHDPSVCIFSGNKSGSVKENVKWMEKAYSFFIPEKEYVSDMEALISYLSDKIYDKLTCIYCHKPFKSIYAVLHHMEQKQHRKLDDDALTELRQFYDFTLSYVELIPSNNRILNIENDKEDNDDDWEDIVTAQTDSQTAIQRLASYGLTKAKINEGGNLTLPNGREAVHREVSYVYKQHLVVRGNYPTSGTPAGFKFLKKDIKKQIVRGELAKRNHMESERYKMQYKSYKLFVPCNQIAFAT